MSNARKRTFAERSSDFRPRKTVFFEGSEGSISPDTSIANVEKIQLLHTSAVEKVKFLDKRTGKGEMLETIPYELPQLNEILLSELPDLLPNKSYHLWAEKTITSGENLEGDIYERVRIRHTCDKYDQKLIEYAESSSDVVDNGCKSSSSDED